MSNKIYFKYTTDSYGWLSNFSFFHIIVDDIYYKTVEHYYQSHKMKNKQDKWDIINASTPNIAALYGRDKKRELVDNWEDIKLSVMMSGLLHKVHQHKIIEKSLIATGSAELIEMSEDAFWGSGNDMKGRNNLGKMWMAIRDQYKGK